jgi:protein arginine N-methyltransferase 1
VEEPDLYSRYTAPWDNKEFGLDMEGARRIAINMWSKARIKPEQLLVKPQCWAALDYALLESYDASSKVNWVIEQGGTAHGLGVWFDSDLVESVNLSNAPGAPELIYGNAFFPLLNPVDLAKCDTVNVEITANLVGEDYIWRWNFTVLSEGNPQKIKADFKQSSFLATPLSPSTLRKIADNHVPVLNENAQIDQFIISMMDGNASLGDIAHQVMKKFPNRFSKWYDVLTHVGKLSEKYSE